MQRALVICPSDASSDRGLQEIAHEQGQSMLTLWNSLILKACSHGIVMGTKLSRFE
jgi:ABC-type molybdate transport system permease subunit